MATKRRSRNGWGTIRKTRDRFTAQYTGPDGARHTPGHSFATRTDAQGWLASERRLIDREEWTPPKQRAQRAAEDARREQERGTTVGELVEDWLNRSDLKPTTRASHRKRLELRALTDKVPGLSSLRDVRVVDVNRQRVRQWVEEMNTLWPYGANGYSTSYYAHKRLVTAFNWARDELELIDGNPISLVSMRKPQTVRRDEAVYTETEADALVQGFPTWLRHAPMIMLWCGLRLGELLELRRRDITGLTPGAAMTLRVRRVMQDIDGEDGGKVVVINDSPKSTAGRRDVVVPAEVADAIRAHLTEANKVDPDALIVSRTNGHQFTQHGFRDRYFKVAKDRAGRSETSPHSCRRFYGTQLVRLVMVGELSIEEARRLMGHETVEQLMEYQRAEAGYQRRAARALSGLRRAATSPSDEVEEERDVRGA
ncbi:site-specific integrase [Corynebacterium sanguinis]|uniref:tyrosine-type recombinase/integrase n=1 Tax=Corynebacterium sanguinis TaxID=2594913 RepID=UPI0021A3E826|nr:site-specific integrase [Corynebacterium sanguinis]MCT2250970.1 site-specific integrase [Corynebacterium sanguinis]